MKKINTKIKDLFIIEPDIFEDHRGWFMEAYNKEIFKKNGIEIDFIQDNHSFTLKKGTIRGLHFQKHPYTQSKLIRCTRGKILDVAVDLRKDSSNFKQWVSIELSEDNKKIFFIPKGFAHGFISLTDNVEVQYKVDNYYNKDAEVSIHFNDPEIGIEWNHNNPILVDKDKNAPFLKDCDINF